MREHCDASWTIALRIAIGARLMTMLRNRTMEYIFTLNISLLTMAVPWMNWWSG